MWAVGLCLYLGSQRFEVVCCYAKSEYGIAEYNLFCLDHVGAVHGIPEVYTKWSFLAISRKLESLQINETK
jgi:hypothetical protein